MISTYVILSEAKNLCRSEETLRRVYPEPCRRAQGDSVEEK
jgi:hypothetical protein